MKFSSRLLFGLILVLSGLFFMPFEMRALSVSDVNTRNCHYENMDGVATHPWGSFWVCGQPGGSSAGSQATIFWVSDQIDNGFRVEYSIDDNNYSTGLSVTTPIEYHYMWRISGLLPSRKYYFRIRSSTMGTTDLFKGEFNTYVGQGSFKYKEGFGIDFDVWYDSQKKLKWETYNFSSGRGGGCGEGNLSPRSGDYTCGGRNTWVLEDRGTSVFIKTTGTQKYDGNTGFGHDNDNRDASASFNIYAPNHPPTPSATISLSKMSIHAPTTTRRDSAMLAWTVADAESVSVSEIGDNLEKSGSRVVSPVIGTAYNLIAYGYPGGNPKPGYGQTRPTFSPAPVMLNVIFPDIVLRSDQFDVNLPLKFGTLEKVRPTQTYTFTITNPVSGSLLNYAITVNDEAKTWLAVSHVSGADLHPGLDNPSIPVTVSFTPERLMVRSTSYTGTITVYDASRPSLEKKIYVEFAVTNISDFSLSVTSPPVLVQGNSVGAKVVVTKTTGIASNVTLSVSGLPTGVTGVLEPSTCTAAALSAPCASILTLSASADAVVGSKTVTVTAKKALDQHGPAREEKRTFTLTVSKSFGVSLALSPALLQITERGTGSVRILATITAQGGKEVKFEAQGLPAGATGTFVPASCAQTCTATLTIRAGSASSGSSSVSVKAVGSDGKTATGSLSLVIKSTATTTPRPTVTGKPGPTQIPVTPRPTAVQPPGGGGGGEEPDPISFSLVTVRTLSVIQGSMTNTSVILSYEGGDPESVRIAVSQLPKNADASLSLTQCVPNCYAVLTIRTKNTTPLGSSNVKITASSRGLVRTSFIELIVGTDPPLAPAALSQKNVKDGADTPLGGTVREDRLTFVGLVDHSQNQKMRLRVEVKPVKEFFNGVTGVFEEPMRLVEKGSTYEVTGTKLVGGYKWRAQAVDERGMASQWSEFGTNGDEPDFITDLSTPPTNPFEANQGDPEPEEERPGFFRRIFGWVCYIPGIKKLCN